MPYAFQRSVSIPDRRRYGVNRPVGETLLYLLMAREDKEFVLPGTVAYSGKESTKEDAERYPQEIG